MNMAQAEINGIDIHYRLHGEGEPLMLVMGMSGNADWWDPRLLGFLAERFQVLTFDNRGSGRTGKPEGPYTIAQMASDALGLMDHLGWECADVLGMSMGGMIAQEVALEYPERVRRLVLVSTHCGGQEQVPPEPDVQTVLTSRKGSLSPEEIIRATMHLLFTPEFMEKDPGLIEAVVGTNMIAPIPLKCFNAQLHAYLSYSNHHRLCDLRHPTLIIHGDRDILIPPENARVLADAIPDARMVLIPEAGHAVTTMNPEEVAQEVLDFLSFGSSLS